MFSLTRPTLQGSRCRSAWPKSFEFTRNLNVARSIISENGVHRFRAVIVLRGLIFPAEEEHSLKIQIETQRAIIILIIARMQPLGYDGETQRVNHQRIFFFPVQLCVFSPTYIRVIARHSVSLRSPIPRSR